MSVKKLTLSADEEIIRKARTLAKRNGTSISAMFSRFVSAMSATDKKRPEISPLTKKASGLIEWPDDVDERQILEEAILKKYGLET